MIARTPNSSFIKNTLKQPSKHFKRIMHKDDDINSERTINVAEKLSKSVTGEDIYDGWNVPDD